MEINLGLTTAGLRKLADEINAACDEGTVEVTRYFEPNGPGQELTVVFNNDDMDDRPENAAFWE